MIIKHSLVRDYNEALASMFFIISSINHYNRTNKDDEIVLTKENIEAINHFMKHMEFIKE